LVAGATRGAGRGIARALGEAGATVYCTGRSVRGKPSPYKRPETIEETAELVEAAGGVGVALRVDHTVETEVRRLFKRIENKHRRLDVVVNCIAGEDPLMGQWASFWEVDVRNADAILRQAFTSHVITAKHAAQRMIAARRGLIVEVTESDTLGAGGNPFSQAVKVALNMATELKPHRVAALAVTPGFLRSESMLERFDVTDADGRRPDWGRHDIDFGDHPSGLLEYIRTGCELQRDWLAHVSRHTRSLLKQLPAA
jgi:NAD(P)-dependent dehydrogenase (short-subunit alcohol dehydrogenase family)